MTQPQLQSLTEKKTFTYSEYFAALRQKSKFTIVRLVGDTPEMIDRRLKDLMNIRRPFLQRGYCLKDMADDLQIPVHQLSAFLNQVLRMHFNEYMNKYRISYSLELINTNFKGRPDLNQLAKNCGFNTRSAFTSAFKKFTGQPPFEYIKRKVFLQLMATIQSRMTERIITLNT
ncbi:MAG TPA: AraC family transcriptional regulator [Chitinophagaceae bacterium]|nr:AraC family transcriptional regulator [Chitinophagaceae bacterium]